MDYIPLAMMAACLWIAYNGLYMQMCSYRDGQVSDDAALPYATVLDFIRVGEHCKQPKKSCQAQCGSQCMHARCWRCVRACKMAHQR
jgi:hypothetical protein